MILGILLGILKWIGIILLAIVGLILLIVLLVLFCPFTYNIDVEANVKDLKTTKAIIKLGWLFWIIRPVVSYENEKLGIIVRIFGIPINLTKEKKKKKKKKPAAKKQTSEAKKQTSEAKKQNNELSESKADIDEVKEQRALVADTDDINEIESDITDEFEAELIEIDSFDKNDSINDNLTSSSKKASVFDKIKSFFKREKKAKKPKLSAEEKKKLKEAKKKELEEKLKKLKDSFARAKEIYKTLTDKETKEAIRLVLNVLKKSLKHLLPRRIRGKLKYGFENPETTGQVLSIMAMAYPLHKGHIGLLPIFETEEMVLDGRINLRGHVMLGFFVLQLLRLWNNKLIKNMIKSAMSK